MNLPKKPSLPQYSAIGGPLPVLLDFRNGGRGWRMSLGALVQAALLGLVLVVPLLFTESFTARPDPPELRQTIRFGNPQAAVVHGPKPQGTPVRPPLRSDQVYLRPNVVQPESLPISTASIGDPTIGIEGGTGPGWFGDPHGDPHSQSTTGPVGQGNGTLRQPPPPTDPIRVGGDVRPPRLIRRVEPLYPRLAKIAGIQGDVYLEALLDKDGRVRNLEVKSGHPMLVDAAREAVAQWVYEPTYLNGVPYPVLFTVKVEFRLRH